MRRLIFINIFSWLCCLFTCQAQIHHALIIGIGEYEDPRWGLIHADADINFMVKVVKDNGYDDIRTLKNSEATKDAIVKEFETLIEECKSGDKVYIHFSGHGQQITDIDGDEDDGYDEAWIPYDAHPYYSESYKGENHLTDDELCIILSNLKRRIGDDGRIVVAVDACHSGDATREIKSSDIARGFNKKFEIPCKIPKHKRKNIEKWITISACLPYQINWEVSNPSVGKLTWSLYCLRTKLSTLTNVELRDAISHIMQENPGPIEQTPTLSGSLTSESVSEIF